MLEMSASKLLTVANLRYPLRSLHQITFLYSILNALLSSILVHYSSVKCGLLRTVNKSTTSFRPLYHHYCNSVIRNCIAKLLIHFYLLCRMASSTFGIFSNSPVPLLTSDKYFSINFVDSVLPAPDSPL